MSAVGPPLAERHAWLRLLTAPLPPRTPRRALADAFGGAAALFAATPRELQAAGVHVDVAEALRRAPQPLPPALLALAADPRRMLLATEAAYPARLREIADAPPVLFVEGDPETLASPQVALVGARDCTPEARETATLLSAGLARAGFTITSGLARGIDAAAHRAALDAGGITIGVAGTGLDRCYPREHAWLVAAATRRGAVVSEFLPGTPARAHHFPRRNRIISGLALAVVVVEAGLRSGSLVTARFAAEQGREVGAVPGSVHNPLARGCHRLLRDGAALVEDVGDVLAQIGFTMGESPLHPPARPSTAPGSDEGDEALLSAMGHAPVTLDDLVRRTGLTAAVVSSKVQALVLAGRVSPGRGATYVVEPEQEVR